jgi:DNA-damage-inducible protein J
MSSTSMLHVRIDDDVKEKATQAVEAMGLTLSGAVKLFLTRVAAEQAIPFAVKVPNAVTRAAMAEADEMIAEGQARFGTGEDLFDALDKEDRR